MIVVNSVATLRRLVNQYKSMNQRVGFVPTMGNLHQGHLSLVDCAKQHADVVIVSIFVNPTQFGPNEDFDSYPRTLEQDCALLEERGTDIVFAPAVEEVYPQWPNITSVSVAQLGLHHCGGSRPGHFDGVTTVVSKLFNMVQPDTAVFGEKDFQQLAIIRRMTSDMNFPIQVIGAPIMRETNGLAMSSRNGYLSIAEKEQAAKLQQSLQKLKQRLLTGESNYRQLEQETAEELDQQGFKTDYIHITNPSSLELAETPSNELVILAAAFLGKVRLIDNIYFNIPS